MNILDISFSLPKQREKLESAAKRLNMSDDEIKIFDKIFGLKYLPISSEKNVESLMLEATIKCLKKTKISPTNIKWIVHAHTANQSLPFYQNAIRYIKYQLKFDNAHSFGTSMNKCASVFTAFQIAEELFNNLSSNDYILVLTGDVTFTDVMQYIPGTTILSDGACAILLTKNHFKNEIVNIQMNIYGEFAGGKWDHLDTQKLFEKHYNQYLAEVITQCITHANLSIQDIKLILPHNVNMFSWQKTAKLLKIPINKIFLYNISQIAHCFGSDPFLNYISALEKKYFQPNDYLVMATVGLGATFAAMVIKH